MFRSRWTNLNKTPTTGGHPNPFLRPQFNSLFNNLVLLNDLVYETYLEKLGLSPSAGEESVSKMLRIGNTIRKKSAKRVWKGRAKSDLVFTELVLYDRQI